MGFKIFRKAVQLVLGNLGDAFRISALLYFLPLVVLYLFVFATGLSARSDAVRPLLLVFTVVDLVAVLWLAVAWHRYVLLDEKSSNPLPAFRSDRILVYFGRSLLLGLVELPIIVILALAGFSVSPAIGSIATVVILVALGFCALAITYRLALILPAAAVGKPLTLREAWAATRGHSGTVIVVAVLSLICALLLAIPSALLGLASPLLAGLWDNLVAGWLEVMVGVSILTTLYGHFIEGRAVE